MREVTLSERYQKALHTILEDRIEVIDKEAPEKPKKLSMPNKITPYATVSETE